MKLNRMIRIVMTNDLEWLRGCNLDPQLFSQLAAQACLQRLTRLTLSTGELPPSPEVDMGLSFGNQITTFTDDQARGDLNRLPAYAPLP